MEKLVSEAILNIREVKKHKPTKIAVAEHVVIAARKSGLGPSCTLEEANHIIDKMVKENVIFENGEDSYFLTSKSKKKGQTKTSLQVKSSDILENEVAEDLLATPSSMPSEKSDRETQSFPHGASASLSKNTREMLEESGKGNSFHDDEVNLQKNEKEREKTVSKQSAKPHQNQKNLSTTSNTDFIVSSRRLDNLEKKVDEILFELKKPKKEDTGKSTTENQSIHSLLLKIDQLANINKSLENENAMLKTNAANNMKSQGYLSRNSYSSGYHRQLPDLYTQDPNNEMTNIPKRAPGPMAARNQWSFPKVTTKKPKLFSNNNPVLTSNRYTSLQVDEENSECDTFLARNVVPGNASYSESVRGKNRQDQNMRSDSFAWPNENEGSNERADERFGFGQDGCSKKFANPPLAAYISRPAPEQELRPQSRQELRPPSIPINTRQSFQERQYSNQRNQRSQQNPSLNVVGDSMIRSINRRVLNEETEGWNIRVKTFGGAKVEDMDYYLEPTLQYKPKAIILHCGTNNLRRDSPEVVANKVISLAVKVKRRVANVAVSGIIMRTDSNELEQKRREANELIKRGLHQHHVDFIDHENINSYHLDNSGLHLNQFGTNILSGNFIDFLKT